MAAMKPEIADDIETLVAWVTKSKPVFKADVYDAADRVEAWLFSYSPNK